MLFGRWYQLLSHVWVRYCVSSLYHITLNKLYFISSSCYHWISFYGGDSRCCYSLETSVCVWRWCIGASSVRWCVKYFKVGNTSIRDQLRSGRPRTASTASTKKRVDEIIKTDVWRWTQWQQIWNRAQCSSGNNWMVVLWENVWAQPYSVGVIDPVKRTCENYHHYFMGCTD
jgi:hypothetical protein